MPFSALLPKGSLSSTATTALAILPVAAPVAYFLYWNWRIGSITTSNSGRFEAKQTATAAHKTDIEPPKSLPEEVTEDPSQWVVSYERVVSRPLQLEDLTNRVDPQKPEIAQPSALFTSYLRATHKAFSWTPQAFLIRSLLKEPLNRASFNTKWIENLDFKDGDIVNGVYKVSHVSSDKNTHAERVELLIDTPASYDGPAVRGLILSATEPNKSEETDSAEQHDGISFINETWMWRLKEEKPTLLESRFGGWFHGLLAGWLIVKGMDALGCEKDGKAKLQ